MLQASYSSPSGSERPALSSHHRSMFLYCWQGCPTKKIHQVPCPSLHCPSVPLLSWALLEGIAKKMLSCLAGSEATPPWNCRCGAFFLFYRVCCPARAACWIFQDIVEEKIPIYFKYLISLNKRLPRGNLPNQLLFYSDEKQCAQADSLIRMLSRGHKNSLQRCPSVFRVMAHWFSSVLAQRP